MQESTSILEMKDEEIKHFKQEHQYFYYPPDTYVSRKDGGGDGS